MICAELRKHDTKPPHHRYRPESVLILEALGEHCPWSSAYPRLIRKQQRRALATEASLFPCPGFACSRAMVASHGRRADRNSRSQTLGRERSDNAPQGNQQPSGGSVTDGSTIRPIGRRTDVCASMASEAPRMRLRLTATD